MRNDGQLKYNNEEFATQRSTPVEVCDESQQVTRSLLSTHAVCEQHNDVATFNLLEKWIDA